LRIWGEIAKSACQDIEGYDLRSRLKCRFKMNYKTFEYCFEKIGFYFIPKGRRH
jgi:hypothetical protein